MSRLEKRVLRIPLCKGGFIMRVWISAVVALLTTIMPIAALAQQPTQPPISVSLTAHPDVLTVGDIVVLTFEITHPVNHVVVVHRLNRDWGAFEIVSQSPVRSEPEGGGIARTRQQLEVTLFMPGTFETPVLPLSIRKPDGRIEQVFAPPVELTVNSVLSGTDDQLIDIRSPADMSAPSWRSLNALAVAAFAAAVLALALFFMNRRLRGLREQPVSAIDTRTPWEIAVQEIERIERIDLPGDGRFKEHYALVARVTKDYVRATCLEDPSGAHAREMTTDEMVTALSQSSLDRRNVRRLVEFFLEADLVQFSNYSPQVSQAYEALRRARDFIKGTKPAVEDAAQHREVRNQSEATA